MKIALKEAFGYTVASGCALLFDMTILWILVQYCGCNPMVAATISFMSGTFVAYTLSVKLIFNHRRLEDWRTEFAGFAALGIVGLIVNNLVMSLTIRYFGLYYLVAKIVAAGFTLVCNFVMRRQLLFTQAHTT